MKVSNKRSEAGPAFRNVGKNIFPTLKSAFQIPLLFYYFRVPPGFCIKTRLSAQPLIRKWFFILMQIKLIFARKVVYLASFWKRGFWNSEVFLRLLVETRPLYMLSIHPSHAKVQPFAGQKKHLHSSAILRPWVLVRSRESNPRPPALQLSALPTELILPRLSDMHLNRIQTWGGVWSPRRKENWITSNPFKLMTTKLSSFSYKFIWKHFEVVVTCMSALTLPWQPSFHSYVFQNLLYKQDFFSIFIY